MKGGYTSACRCCNKVCGLKPKYGKISRYGLMAYVSSTDCVWLVSQKLEDIQVVLDGIEVMIIIMKVVQILWLFNANS